MSFTLFMPNSSKAYFVSFPISESRYQPGPCNISFRIIYRRLISESIFHAISLFDRRALSRIRSRTRLRRARVYATLRARETVDLYGDVTTRISRCIIFGKFPTRNSGVAWFSQRRSAIDIAVSGRVRFPFHESSSFYV